ncbi:hypothetical protein [Streptomyces sp. M41(2017)]|uniref:hypothetical protein n=1 Tax=unclassified Streptomyces TaxID=2593676 RepID=UPI0009BE0D95|nr:hypothetical protein [Streptomyces sp. M41(2017)]OQQ20033.1 hypothetical protein B0675_25460 [Streptomyces sp. M41(2017)]
MQTPDDALDQARRSYDEHLNSCRQCAADRTPCAVAKHLRRVCNSLDLAARRGAPGGPAPRTR